MAEAGAEELARLERKARREERRERQRGENVIRAQKMHEARLRAVENSHVRRQDRPEAASQRFNVGCSGWFYWHWRDLFYPSSIATNKWFEYYAARFRTVELNAPFYSWPTVGTVESWLRQIGRRRFVYTVKVCELITHTKRFKGTKELIQDFGYIGDLLGSRMGCLLFQFPPSFHYTAARLRSILSQLEPRFRNVVEFRHASWWREDVYAAFRETGALFCSCSAPRLPDALVKTAPDIYIRFHGRQRWYRHDYQKPELADWVERIRASRAERVWAYFNNDREGCAISNARQLLRMLKAGPEQSTVADDNP